MKMKFLIVLLAIIATGTCAFGLTACNTNQEHTHNLTYYSEVEPTCIMDGHIEYWRCYGCNKMFSDADGINEITDIKIIANGHSYSEEWSNNSTYHWYAASCDHTDLTSDKQLHQFEDNVCSVCSYKADFTTSLIFEEIRTGDNKGNYFVSGVKNLTESEIIIPSTYNDKPVILISSAAFKNCKNLSIISIPESVINIYDEAFDGCDSLTKVYYNGEIEDWCKIGFGWRNANPLIYAHNLYINGEQLTELVIPSGVEKISDDAFRGANITSITIPASVKTIGSGSFSECNYIKKATVAATVIKYIPSSNLQEIFITSGDISDNAFKNCQSLKKVTIGNDVKSIGDYAFFRCSNLKDVMINNGVTSIGYEAFCECSSLISVDVPNSVTTIGSRAFWECTALIEVKLGANVTEIGYAAFLNCSSLESMFVATENESFSSQDGILYNKNQTEFILVPTKIKGAVTIPDGITEIIDHAFHGRTELTEISMSDNVTYVGVNAFYECTKLKKVNCGNNVNTIGSASFNLCYSLAQVNLGNRLTTIDSYAFSGCTNLYSITLPETLKSIGENAFQSCPKLIEIYNQSNLLISKNSNNYGAVGKNALNIYTSTVGASNLTTTEEGLVFYKDISYCYLISYVGDNQQLILPSSFNGIKYSIYNYAFSYSDIESITFPNTITSTGYGVCYKCSNLKNVTIPSNIATIDEWAFYGCSNITNIELLEGITRICNEAFGGCSGLENIVLPESLKQIDAWVFSGCSALKCITIPKSLTSVGTQAFLSCQNLERVNYTGDIGEWCAILFSSYEANPLAMAKNLYINGEKIIDVIIPNTTTTIRDYAFYNCADIKCIKIPDTVNYIGKDVFYNTAYYNDEKNWFEGVLYIGNHLIKAKETLAADYTVRQSTLTIASGAFTNCSDLKYISLPNTIVYIGSSAFVGCKSLESIAIPYGVTRIGDYTFSGCKNLNSVVIPISITEIGTAAFDGNDSLKYVYFEWAKGEHYYTSLGYNGSLSNAEAYYFSDIEPALNEAGNDYDGNYWHYDVDGCTPVIWGKEN